MGNGGTVARSEATPRAVSTHDACGPGGRAPGCTRSGEVQQWWREQIENNGVEQLPA